MILVLAFLMNSTYARRHGNSSCSRNTYLAMVAMKYGRRVIAVLFGTSLENRTFSDRLPLMRES